MGRRLALCFALLLVAVALLGAAFYWYPLAFFDWKTDRDLRAQGVVARDVMVDGYRIHYVEAAAHGGAGQPLLLVHGLAGRGKDLGALMTRFAGDGYHVYALDLLGYGRSDRPDVDYTISLEQKIVADFMQQVGLPRADVVGHSMGGWIALELALAHPERVRRLVLYDSAGLKFDAGFSASMFAPRTVAELRVLGDHLSPHYAYPPPFVQRAVLRQLKQNQWVADRSLRSMTGGREALDGKLGSLAMPVLLLWGAEDAVTPVSLATRIHRDIAGSELVVVEGTGHLAPLECAGRVVELTETFLHATSPTRGESTVACR